MQIVLPSIFFWEISISLVLLLYISRHFTCLICDASQKSQQRQTHCTTTWLCRRWGQGRLLFKRLLVKNRNYPSTVQLHIIHSKCCWVLLGPGIPITFSASLVKIKTTTNQWYAILYINWQRCRGVQSWFFFFFFLFPICTFPVYPLSYSLWCNSFHHFYIH